MPLYDQKDDKKEKSHQHKSKTDKQAPRSSGNSAGASENEDQNTKPQELAFRDMSFRQQYIYILRYGSGFKWYEGQGEGETLNNPYVQDDNNIQSLKQQERAFNDMTLVQKLTWSLHLGNAVGDAIALPQGPTTDLEAFLRKQGERSTTLHPVNEHGSPSEKPPLSKGNTSASTPSLFLRPGERPVAPPLAPGRMNALHHYLLTKQIHGAEPMPVKPGGLFFPGAGAATIRVSNFASDLIHKQDGKVPEYSQLMKMNPRNYLSVMNKKHGTKIYRTRKVGIHDGHGKSVYILTMLENKGNKISSVHYEPFRDFPQALVDDLELYRTRNNIPQQTFTPQVSPSVDL
ncbi:hypothetical protein, partial [Serratia sp. M24T3]|uniref:hypothetical protein n=1 Tax=Serratia sp. M24T3 TaxID=932213 RepID=UPI00025BBCEC